MSNFATLQSALSGLIAQRRVIDNIGHNIANANTDGYSRRVARLSPGGVGNVPAVHFKPGEYGQGVKIDSVVRVRDEFLETRALHEQSLAASLHTQATVLGRVERTFPEPSDNGISAVMSQFWASWDDVANSPDDLAVRTAALENGHVLARELNNAAAELGALRDSSVTQAQNLVTEANGVAERVAALNTKIRAHTAAGLDANDFLDQRDMLLNELTDLVGVTVRHRDDNTVDVFVGGSTLVHGDKAEALTVDASRPAAAGTPLAAVGLSRVAVQIGGYDVNVSAGQVGGHLAAANTTVPKYLDRLNEFSVTVADAVNAVHTSGQALDGTTGLTFFSYGSAADAARTLAVSADVAGQPERLAAAAVGAGAWDASVAQQLAAVGDDPAGPATAYRDFVGALGVEAQATTRQAVVQQSTVLYVDQERLSVSSVSIDEEMVNLVAAQHAYSAASRVVTAVDEALDTLINRTGLVGR